VSEGTPYFKDALLLSADHKFARSMDQSLSPTQLQDLLNDTQESLAASFARIEVFRLQNKQLREELAQLRAQVHGSEGQAPPSQSKESSSLEACALQFPQQRSMGSHPIMLCDGLNKVLLQYKLPVLDF